MDSNRPNNKIHTETRHPRVHHHLLTFHTTGILVLLVFIVSQFFFIHLVVDAGEMTSVALLDCSNTIRLQYQPNALLPNDLLEVAAGAKLDDMKQYDYWAHVNPLTGKQPWDFVQEAGYQYETAGENLAIGFDNSQQICDAWEKSKKHFENIINPTFKDVGFAIDKANLHQNEKGILVVQMLASRNVDNAAIKTAAPPVATAKAQSPPSDVATGGKNSSPANEVLGATYNGEMDLNNILFFVIVLSLAIAVIGVLLKKAFKKFQHEMT